MLKKDWKAFTELLTTLAVMLQVEPTDALMKAYWIGLKDMEIIDITRAIEKAIRTVKDSYGRLPLPADLRELAGDDPGQRATQAWQHVLNAIVVHGTARTVDFDDGLINACVVEAGGWQGLGKCNEVDLDWRRREFITAYRHAMKRPPPLQAQLPLAGYSGGPPKFIATGLVENSQRHLGVTMPGRALKLVGNVGGEG